MSDPDEQRGRGDQEGADDDSGEAEGQVRDGRGGSSHSDRYRRWRGVQASRYHVGPGGKRRLPRHAREHEEPSRQAERGRRLTGWPGRYTTPGSSSSTTTRKTPLS